MIQIRGFNGKLNLDDNPYRSPKNDHVDALNITRDAEGEGQDAVVSNIVGNQEVSFTNVSYTIQSNVVGDITTYNISFSGNFFTNGEIIISAEDSVTAEIVELTNATSIISIGNIAQTLYDNANTVIPGVSFNLLIDNGIQVIIDGSISNLGNVSVFLNAQSSYGFRKTIGNYADRLRNRHYYFIWDGDGYNQINYYDLNTGLIVNVLEDLTGTGNVPILNFNPSYRINHVDIIYRDEDGDLLFWTDGLNPPSKINVKKAINGEYGVIERGYIDVAKEPPSYPPYCVYEDDSQVTINNLNNKQFKFKYRYVYDDLEKSVTSAQTEVPIPKNYSAQSVFVDPTKNAKIFILLQTGAENVTKIEILAAESQGSTYSDFFLVQVLDKAELSIPSNDTVSFRFYNDQAYLPISIEESIQPFDYVPQKAISQSLPNGNVLNYGGITENYDLINPNFVCKASQNSFNSYYLSETSLVYANFSTKYESTIGYALKLTVAGNPNIGDNFTINLYNNNVLTIILTYTATAATASNVLVGLSNFAQTTYGWLAYSLDGTIYLTDPSLVNYTINPTIYSFSPNYTKDKNSSFAYDWSSRYAYGVVYFDEKGRTNGVITNTTGTVQTQPYDETSNVDANPNYPFVPNQSFEIYNRPPIWANYYEIVRTKNLTKINFLYWVSERTFKDEFENEAGYQYAYISISTLLQYIIDNPESKSLGYEFADGDRIRFVKLYNVDGTTNQLYNTSSKDFAIINSVTNPKINGIDYDGQFIKILLPTTSVSFDFGGDTYANYLIQLYSPNPSFDLENTVYYEFGQRYSIGNYGTPNAYHIGMFANQSIDLTQPATFSFHSGDSYFRYRLYPRGGTGMWTMNTGVIPVNGTRGGVLDSDTTNNIANFTLVTNPTAWWFGNPAGNPTKLINIVNTTRTYSWKIKGSISLNSTGNLPYAYLRFNSNDGLGNFTDAYVYIPDIVANTSKTITYSTVLTSNVGHQYVSVVLSGVGSDGTSATFQADIENWSISITENNAIFQGIIDPNFSDNYESSASPNGRPWKFDADATQEYNPTLIRFGGEYQQGSSSSNINRFYDKNFDVYDRSRGAIKKMFIEGRNLYCFQEFDVGVVTILTQIVRDTAGNPLSAESDRLLNKIVYPYMGGYGIGNVPESFAYGKGAKYFVDNNKAVVCRLAADGITPLSITYKMNAFFVQKLAAFKETLNETIPFDGTPTVYGAFDAFTNKYIIALSSISRKDFQQSAITISYSEAQNETKGFEAFLSYHPENAGALNNLLITFLAGKLYTHNSNVFCNFYGNQYSAYIDVVFNDNPLDRKTYQAINQTSSDIWYCPSILSQAISGNTVQLSSLSAARFSLLEGQYSSAILRDINSPGGLINGQTMKGNYLIVRFQKDGASSFVFLNTVSLKYINSQLNVR